MAIGKPIRVLVVDDSAFMRKVLQGIISSDPDLQVCGEARDGRDAITQLESLKPDVISMDINMPHMDGLQATEVIMSSNPHPVLIVSSESREGADVTLKALQLGAIDFVSKPTSGIDLDMSSIQDELCRKLKMAAKVRVVRTAARSAGQQQKSGTERPAPKIETAKLNGRSGGDANHRGAGKFPIVVVASSTGGPATLMKFIPAFPADFPGAVIVVQHMPGNFTSQFSKQLAEVSEIKVKEAEAGEIVVPGQVYVCPGSNHLRVSATGRVVLDDGPRIGGYRPCADLTLESVVAYSGPNAVAVILTGMGNDGSKGVQAVKAAGGYVIAQDESTAVIFGMPQEAIKTGAVDQVLPVDSIYPAVEKRVMAYTVSRVGAL
ncbi:MAG TPA: chemotaxis response regulator protein-glutamate methylesterase [Candidatus Acidoferrales bacterium]|jgi:two-component system chemotaxis response regulator CheB|nr:chemotaxis response regulator protein-glutamate methylesterase [Candidatus Acidoferrales bacterium]